MKSDSYSRFLKSKMYQDCVLAEMAGEELPFLKTNTARDTKSAKETRRLAGEEKTQKKKVRKKEQGKKDFFL